MFVYSPRRRVCVTVWHGQYELIRAFLGVQGLPCLIWCYVSSDDNGRVSASAIVVLVFVVVVVVVVAAARAPAILSIVAAGKAAKSCRHGLT